MSLVASILINLSRLVPYEYRITNVVEYIEEGRTGGVSVLSNNRSVHLDSVISESLENNFEGKIKGIKGKWGRLQHGLIKKTGHARLQIALFDKM